MKRLLLILSLLVLTNANAGIETRLEKTPLPVLNILKEYLKTNGFIGENDPIITALDDDYIHITRIQCVNGEVYSYAGVYSGDTEHGPIFYEYPARIVGENSDGDYFLYSGTKAQGMSWVDCWDVYGLE